MIIFELILFSFFVNSTFCLETYDEIDDETLNPSPLILIPGDGGSRSYATIESYFMTLTRLVWVNFQYMIFPGQLTDVFKLVYDPVTHITSDAPKVKVYFPDWGSTETIESLGEWKHPQTTYFAPLVQELIKDKYFIRNKTIRGAPYDFRKAPNENPLFVNDLRLLIEETYYLAGNKRVVLLGHSLGSLYSLYFLNKMSLDWKKYYIRSFIAASAPLGGAVKAVNLEIEGDSLGSPRNSIYFREMQRSFPSTAFLLPRANVFGDTPIVITPNKNYTANDYETLFKDLNFPYGAMMFEDTKDLVDGSIAPEGIDEVYCFHGHGLKTEEQLMFSDLPDKKSQSIFGDGDSTVNLLSLEICKKWTNVHYQQFKEADHLAIIGDPRFINEIKDILYQKSNISK